MSEHSTLTDGTSEQIVAQALVEIERALAPITPSPRQRELALRAAALKRAFAQARSCTAGSVERWTSLRDMALALYAEAMDLVVRRQSYRRLCIRPTVKNPRERE